MRNFLIIHGTMGDPKGNWFPWLKTELEKSGHNVIVPTFPTPEGQSLSAWSAVAQKALSETEPANTTLIGHSLGAAFALRLAESASAAFKAAFIISPFMHTLGIDPYDELNSTFISQSPDWPRIRKNLPSVYAFAGQNDPYVPLPFATEVAQQVGAELTVVEKGGHLNEEFGYREFPLLLDKIRQTMD